MSKICIKCGNQIKSRRKDLCDTCYSRMWSIKNPEKRKKIDDKKHLKAGNVPMSENKKCPSYLGVYVAEIVLSNVFNNVVKLPYGNIGFDFICNKGMKIDVKSSCLRYHKKSTTMSWGFRIHKNKIADYFLCLAFDNREDLNPMFLWLLPANQFNHVSDASISINTVDKWNQYNISIDKVKTCCDSMRVKVA